ncbi:histone deacetylase family protein [Fodinicurvata sp. EGI_FJ10296]|uniref:histone deacetylase family protein n=1 Tax=Fodinicurvata sp. EGI_FJ10296 TaxID=3231908 RepID=UPI003451F031
MNVYYDRAQKAHAPKHFLVSGAPQPSPEKPERADAMLSGAVNAGLTPVVPPDAGLGPIAAVHTPEYITFLSTIYERWQRIDGASAEVVPNIHPDRRDGAYPKSAVGQAGYHMADTACPISADSWPAIRRSADAAVAAAQAVLAETESNAAPKAYALCRPPGHHAFADMAGGFCFVNNSAVAAGVLRSRYDRVAILDVDLHHGNGTQGVFYARPDVLTVSIHADPVRFYPFFWGHADERGSGAGLGYNYNLPIPRGTADADYMPTLDAALARIAAFAPGALVVALGLDSRADDPFGGLSLTPDGYGAVGRAIAQLGLPTTIVQEGGYLSDDLGPTLTSFLQGIA